MNRRDMLKRLGAAGLVAATLDTPRFWSLDRTMLGPATSGVMHDARNWETVQFMYQHGMISRQQAMGLLGYELHIVIDDVRYPVSTPEDVRQIVECQRTLRIGNVR